MEFFERYARENPRSVKPDTINQSRMAVELFASTLGPRYPGVEISKKAVREWKALLLDYPVKAAEMAAFRGLSMRELIKANGMLKAPKPSISDRTINRYLSGLGAFCDWLVAQDYLAQNPVTDMHKRIDKTRRSIIPFSVEQLQKLFTSPLFTGCRSEEEIDLPGNHAIRDHRYWLPLIMLFSGARPAEIAQLLAKDVREQHGHWVIHITSEGGEEKSVKTRGSMRIVPVHPELKRLGFTRYCQGMRERGCPRLFPEAERNARGQMAAKFSREFGRYLVRIGIKQGRGLSLYSFRHGFVDALRMGGHLDEEIGLVIGHSKPSTTGQYGIVRQGTLKRLITIVGHATYPGLDVSHLHEG